MDKGRKLNGISLSIVASLLLSVNAMAEYNVTVADDGVSQDSNLFTDRNGRVWAMGSNSNAELGLGYTGSAMITPQEVNISNSNNYPNAVLIDVAAANATSFALDKNGTVYSWGSNSNGETGLGHTTSPVLNPTEVNLTKAKGRTFDANISQIAAGHNFAYALDYNKTVWGWGKNSSGQLGDGTTTNRSNPVEVNTTLANGYRLNISKISCGDDFALFLEANGSVWAVGGNANKQLGNGTTDNNSTLVEVNTTSATGFEINGVSVDLNITDISAGGAYGSNKHGLILEANGSVFAWGTHGVGLGDGATTTSYYPIPVTLPADANISKIYAAYNHDILLDRNGSVWGWGNGTQGQFGDGSNSDKTAPSEINTTIFKGFSEDLNVSSVGVGDHYTIVVDVNNTLYGTGQNSTGQLGVGHTSNTINLELIGTVAAPSNVKVTSVSAGFDLNWSVASPTTPQAVKIYKKPSGGSYSLLTTLLIDNVSYSESNATYYKDTSVAYNTTYYYTLESNASIKGNLREANSTEVSGIRVASGATITAPTSGSTSGTSTNNTTSVDLTWTNGDLTNITSTKVYYSTTSGSNYSIATATTGGTTHTLSSLTPSTRYYFIVGETNSSVGEVNSTETNFYTTAQGPYNVTATPAINSVSLSWTDGSLGNAVQRRGGLSTSNYYRIYKDGVKLTESLSSTSYTVTGLSSSTTYNFIVAEYQQNTLRIVNTTETEANSTTISVTTLPEAVVVETNLISSSTDKTATDNTVETTVDDSGVSTNSAEVKHTDGSSSNIVVTAPEEGSEVDTKSLTLEYSHSEATTAQKTSLVVDKDVNLVVSKDGSFSASKAIDEGNKVLIEGDETGAVSLSIESSNGDETSQKVEVPVGSETEITKDGTLTSKTELKNEDGSATLKVNITLSKDKGAEAIITSSAGDNIVVKNYDGTLESVMSFIKAEGIKREVSSNNYKGVKKTFKSKVGFFASKDSLTRGVDYAQVKTVEIIPTTHWQKFEEIILFNGTRSIQLLLGGAEIVIDGERSAMDKNSVYIIPTLPTEEIENSTPETTNETDSKILYTKKGWNLIALPIQDTIYDMSIFRHKEVIYTYNNVDGWVENPNSIEYGVGFWMSAYESDDITFSGESYTPNLSNLEDGWNLIGTGADITLKDYDIKETWIFNSGQWVSNPDVIKSGQGAWVKN